MSLESSPIASKGGGWFSPGLSTPYEDNNSSRARKPSPSKNCGDLDGNDVGVSWASARANSARVNGQPSYTSKNQGFFGRHMRRISSGLPYFIHGGQDDRFREKEKLGRGRTGRGGEDWKERVLETARRIWLLVRRRKYLAAVVALLVVAVWFGSAPLTYWYRRTSWLGGGSKFVLILAANEGGGVMDWKGAREWAIERDSVRNKKRYAARWGYELEIVDMATKKRYAHEWRESWEKVDVIRNAMKKYPHGEWFWWLDLNTFIMEPSYSLQSHIFNDLGKHTYRDINTYNPLTIVHPPNNTYLDETALSPVGDNNPESINIIVPQDCSGFNLGSFFVRRSEFTDRLLDIWWDPVFYEQRHMEWEHKEQDVLEYIYATMPAIRSSVAFAPQQKFNAFPDGACGSDAGVPVGGCKKALARQAKRSAAELAKLSEKEQRALEEEVKECGVQGVHYQETERESLLVNFAGCEWGRDCWGEMYAFRELSNWLNRTRWEKFKDWISGKARKHDADRAREKREKEDEKKKEREKEEKEKKEGGSK